MEANSSKYRSFNQIVNMIYNEELENLEEIEKVEKPEKQVNILPKFIYDNASKDIKMEIYIGIDTMYKIKKFSEFYECMMENKTHKYGEKLSFVHNKKAFKEEDQPLLDFILKYAEIIHYGNYNSDTNYRFGATALSESTIILNKKSWDDAFQVLIGRTIKLKKETEELTLLFEDQNPDIKFILTKTGENEYVLTPNTDMLKLNIIEGEKYTYLIVEDTLYRCNIKFKKTILKLINAFKMNFSPEVKISRAQLPQLFSIIMPKIKNGIVIDEKIKDEVEKYMPRELISRIYLDFDSNNYLVADLRFVYDNVEYNPLEDDIKKITSRNVIEETLSLNTLRKTGFMLDNKNSRFVLASDDKIYEFITEEIDEYMKKFEVMATENFNKKQLKQPKISSLGIKIVNNLLEIDLESLNINTDELAKIMEKYRLKNRYYRLNDGTFLRLAGNEDIEFLDRIVTGADVDYNELNTGVIRLPVHRSLYLNQLLDGLKSTEISRSNSFDDVIDKLNKDNMKDAIEIPFNLAHTLRYYQKVGFKWLKALDNYNFGGILADDMGLGKTLQILAIIMSYKENEDVNNRRASLVVSPSSLALNWQNETEKFAPDVKTLVISGSSYERKKQIESIGEYDLVITSYDLLKRDIEYYNDLDYKFRYVIADEAQYLKNSNTQNAIAIKQIKADTRYALTGTPMENSLSELWSIFDFIMPGYLFSYRKFRNYYEAPIVKEKDEIAMKKLKMLIEPFVLRRTKTEVLTELPEKTVSVLTSDMQEEQRNIYLSYLAEAKEEVQEAIQLNGLEKSHMRILAVLTRLRQICCHPSVFIENYEGGSSKLDQCMEIVRNGIDAGHKILLFSGYTSMFPIIEDELKLSNIKYFKLTGSTKVSERIELVEEFNSNDEIKVFLISLKAGGTGLNLTGADMVIHYDPWWNASAENQATDRAYRIGQKNNVQVYKLITKDSIEEKIYELQQNKSELIDNMLDINTSFVNKLSREEIMQLFE